MEERIKDLHHVTATPRPRRGISGAPAPASSRRKTGPVSAAGLRPLRPRPRSRRAARAGMPAWRH